MSSSRSRGALLAAGVALAAVAAPTVADAGPLDPPSDQCTDADAPLDPSCVVVGGLASGVRQVCDYGFVPGCEVSALEDPGYAVSADPSPTGRWDWKVGAVHEHSGYSDGDIDAIPRDYFVAAREGRNSSGTGVRLDFLFSSEHSDNTQITPTTNAECISDPSRAVDCAHLADTDFWWKWPSTLRQAREESTADFTAIRGFEWTNDFYNHLNVYFSANYRNVKIDGSYLSMERMWQWLQQPVATGGGADGLVTFNHPGSNPKLSPFDGDLPHADLLASTTLDNWNEVAYVPEVDDRVVGMEVNGGEDIEWFVRALGNGWHIGPVAAEDHHSTSWASEAMHKTMILTRGSTPKDYYWAMANRRTVAIHAELVDGGPGADAVVPTVELTADGRHVLGSRVPNGDGTHTLRVRGRGLPSGSRVALVGSRDGLAAPHPLGTVGPGGTLDAEHRVADREPHWWFAVVCPPAPSDAPACGTDHDYSALTAPIWFE